jgi:hypothetical protein
VLGLFRQVGRSRALSSEGAGVLVQASEALEWLLPFQERACAMQKQGSILPVALSLPPHTAGKIVSDNSDFD